VPATAQRGESGATETAEALTPLTLRFRGLEGAVDALHATFDAWEAARTFDKALDPFGRQVLRLAIHEWLANLVQHAAFGRRRPDVRLELVRLPEAVSCTVEDNSAGFDFERQLVAQEQLVGGPSPSERGRGLLMLIACTEDLAYAPAGRRQRLSFLVRSGAAQRSRLGPLFQLARRS
jgi:serine/threonine-protein kinase RsbW